MAELRHPNFEAFCLATLIDVPLKGTGGAYIQIDFLLFVSGGAEYVC